MLIEKLVDRFFTRQKSAPQLTETTESTEHVNRRKQCFKGKRDLGPFLLSCDGRVIPLRKAYFLRECQK